MSESLSVDKTEFKLDEHIVIQRLKRGYFIILNNHKNEWEKTLLRKKPWVNWIKRRVREKDRPPRSSRVTYYKRYGERRIIAKASNSLGLYRWRTFDEETVVQQRWKRHTFASLHQIKNEFVGGTEI